VEEDETASERPVVETGGRDVVESPKAAIAELGNCKVKKGRGYTNCLGPREWGVGWVGLD